MAASGDLSLLPLEGSPSTVQGQKSLVRAGPSQHLRRTLKEMQDAEKKEKKKKASSPIPGDNPCLSESLVYAACACPSGMVLSNALSTDEFLSQYTPYLRNGVIHRLDAAPHDQP